MPASNVAEQVEVATWPRYLLTLPDGVLLRPGHLVAVRDPRADVTVLGGSVPAWDRARRVIEGDDA
jgi:hypothetical protein